MAGGGGGGDCFGVRFEDIMVHFSTEEFNMLEKWQQQLYFDVLMENYESLIIIGNPVTRSEVIAWFKGGEQQNSTESQESRGGPSSATDGGVGQIYSKPFPEKLETPTMVDSRFEEETAQYGNLGGTPEFFCEPFMHQGSPWREEHMSCLEKATGGLANPTCSQDAAIAPKPYKCQECGDQFRLKGLLRIHQMVSLRKPFLPCPTCGISFPSSWRLKRHQRTHRCACTDSGGPDCPDRCQGARAEERPHFCADCGERFCWYLLFLQHRKSHEEARAWPCAECDAAFTYQSDLAMHEESHLDEALCEPSPCGADCVCRLSFLFLFASQCEKSTEHSVDSQDDEKPDWGGKREGKPYSCHQCGTQFTLEENLETHYRYCYKEQLQKPGRSITPPGGQKNGDRQEWKRLAPKARRSCSGPLLQRSPAGWACSHCRKSFTSRYGLFKHQQRHKAEEGQRATDLNKTTSSTSGSGGRAPVGIMKKLHKCKECGRWFVFKGQLTTHMKTHAEESRSRCDFRGEGSNCKDHSGKHLQVNLGERGPSGRQQESFGVPSVAAEVRRRGEQLCQCGECGKSFTKSYFPAHRAWHSGVRFMCLLCGDMFNFKSGGCRHLQQHRKRRDFSSCPKCGGQSQSKSCFCLIERIYLWQKPLPPLYKPEGMSQPTRTHVENASPPPTTDVHPLGNKAGEIGGE